MDTETIVMGAGAFLEELTKQDNEGTYRPIYAVMDRARVECQECGAYVSYSEPIRWFLLNENAQDYRRRERYNLQGPSIYVFSASGNIEYELIVNTMKLCVEQAAEIERLKKEIAALTSRAG